MIGFKNTTLDVIAAPGQLRAMPQSFSVRSNRKARMSFMLQLMFVPLLLFALLLLTALTAGAQSPGTKPTYRVEFKPGVKTTVVEGTVSPPRTVGPDMTNEGSERYSLRARAGQHLAMEIISG